MIKDQISGVGELKWEQRVRPNGDVIAVLAIDDFRALVKGLEMWREKYQRQTAAREAEMERIATLEQALHKAYQASYGPAGGGETWAQEIIRAALAEKPE